MHFCLLLCLSFLGAGVGGGHGGKSRVGGGSNIQITGPTSSHNYYNSISFKVTKSAHYHRPEKQMKAEEGGK